MTLSYLQDVEEAKQSIEHAYTLWSFSDPLFENERWLAYQAAIARYNALVAEAKGIQESHSFTLPWLHRNVGA